MNGPGLAAIGCLGLCALFAVALSGLGTDEAGLSALVRYSARVSFALFLPVYATSSLRRLWPGPATRWLLRNRRYLGVCFACAHFLHLLAIGLLALLLGDAFQVELPVLLAGGVAYALLAAMALTSSDAAVRRLGPRGWGRLHRLGIHWLWAFFAFAWIGLALEEPAYWAAAGPAWAAAVLRAAAWTRRRGARAETG